MKLYLNIDGVLIDPSSGTLVEGAAEFIEYITREFECYWLTEHCKGDTEQTLEYLSGYFPPEAKEKLKKIHPTCWNVLKTEAIDFDRKFIWLDDSPSQTEIDVIKNFGALKSLYIVNPGNDRELENVLTHLEGIKTGIRNRRKRCAYVILGLLLSFIIGKGIWTGIANHDIGSFETEKTDILQRRNYLIDRVITEPDRLLAEMPYAVGPQFQGEWALYSASMLSAALTNIAQIYPETKQDAVVHIDSLIQIVMSPEIRKYDTDRWGEDPLESLDGVNSHVSYLSHLAWMISGYKYCGGTSKYDDIYRSLCETMNRRILMSHSFNLQTYPGEHVYIPDMLVAIVALANYSRQNNGEYWTTVHKWLERMQSRWIDEESGMIASFASNYNSELKIPAKGSYSALSCYYLTFIDEKFAREQYDRLKENFYQKWPIGGCKEYYDKNCLFGFDIDAGPIIFNLSPTGTAFGIGAATYFQDSQIRQSLLRTAELAGFSVWTKDKRHYLLANVALVGEAITLAMRTAVKWE